MIRRLTGRRAFAASLSALGIAFAGCSVFGPVGDLVSDGYNNTVSYFNAFYNANRLFEEAEEEIQNANRTARSRSVLPQQTNAIPQTARQKLNTVIEKSSHILSLYPESALVDDALILIGKSYYYLVDYLKAERKFTELLTQLPNSPLRWEGQLWLVRTLDKLNKDDDALKMGLLLGADASKQGKRDIAREVYALMGDVERARERPLSSIEHYQNGIEISDDDFLKASMQANIADALFSLGRYEEAALAYLKAMDFDHDMHLEQYCILQAVRAYRHGKRYEQALALIERMLEDFRFNEYFNSAGYEYARTLLESGRMGDAISEYKHVDTTYGRSEYGARAAFDLGELLEKEVGDYKGAELKYARAVEFSTGTFTQEARQRHQALAQYHQLQAKLVELDSLLLVEDSIEVADSSQVTLPDSARSETFAEQEVRDDEGATEQGDTTRTEALQRPQRGRMVSKPVPLNKDSLKIVYARVAYQLGEVFYSDLEVADSAYYWLHTSLSAQVDSSVVPRILFVLADLARQNVGKGYGDSNLLYRQLMQNYPKSSYAEEARRILGIQTTSVQSDPAEKSYAEAESLIETRQYRKALSALRVLMSKYPSSAFAAKSQYTIGWLYEHRLSQPDSALTVYKTLVERHAGSPYATSVKTRIGIESNAVPNDTTTTPPRSLEREEPLKNIEGEKRSDEEKDEPTIRERGKTKKIKD